MRIVLDAMGSDHRPEPELWAIREAVHKWPEDTFYLVGPEDELVPRLADLPSEARAHLHVVHASQVFEETDKPGQDMRRKMDASMAVGIRMIQAGQADAFVTVGNTAGALAYALFILGRLPGLKRPALIIPVPTEKRRFAYLLDAGANAECRPEFLYQFAVMGKTYVQALQGREHPRIGILANGEEPTKGTPLTRAAYALLEQSPLKPYFVGYVEPKEVFRGEVDVVVTDGFTGNIFLKSMEALTKLITDALKVGLQRSLRTRLGALLARPAFQYMKGALLDPREVGAVPLLGVDGLVFIGHGRSDGYAVLNALARAREAVQSGFLDTLRQAVAASVSELQLQGPEA